MKCRILLLLLAAFLMTTPGAHAAPPVLKANPPTLSQGLSVPILLYHRFGPTVADGMTIKTSVFEEHLKYLKSNGYTVIPLRALVDYYLKKGPAPAPKSVVIVEDDAHKSVYSEMLPLAKKYNVPVTVFVYPSAISNAKYAMTWDQLRTLKKNGFDIQSHTYWHPNFKQDKKKMSPAEFEKSVTLQLKKSKERLEKEMGSPVDLLAWPFGIYDDYLLKRAAEIGYKGTFTIQAHHAGPTDSVMKLPRYLLINSDQGKSFARIVEGSAPKRNIVY
ncbi:MAG: polysaccharide deacetylase [Geobacteraceae bacterium GWC2_58_44]|nr:MAG: polysaccharide deacetylase [Geobacteraceae bacterium GWC2_58_44]HBG06123.1 polysaccharide deacetylase [Geobacter sp.]